MNKLLDIQEDNIRDIQLHYGNCMLFDEPRNEYMLLINLERLDNEKFRLLYSDVKKHEKGRVYSLEEFSDSVKVISLEDGYVNLNGYALLCERTIDGKYKKGTALNNTTIQVLGTAYAKVHKKRTKRVIDSYVCLKAFKSRFYSWHSALERLKDRMFSVAMSSSLALVKQPVPEGDQERIHLVYYDVYIGEVVDGIVRFDSHETYELLIDQLKEVGYEA